MYCLLGEEFDRDPFLIFRMRGMSREDFVGLLGGMETARTPVSPPEPLPADPAGACSVFDRHPCAPTVCSVFRRGPCMPEIEYPIGQDLRLTIEKKKRQLTTWYSVNGRARHGQRTVQ